MKSKTTKNTTEITPDNEMWKLNTKLMYSSGHDLTSNVFLKNNYDWQGLPMHVYQFN